MSELTFRRVYPQPVERVFEAFSRPDKLVQWLAPGPAFLTEVEYFDFRMGGGFRVRFCLPDQEASVLAGSYLHVDSPHQLTFTWEWLAPDPHAGILSEVAVRLEPQKEGTVLHLTHGRLTASGMPGRHAAVWPVVLERLNILLETP